MAGRRVAARSDEGAMRALLRANERAGEIKAETPVTTSGMTVSPPGIVRGAPTHDLAYLLTALEEAGWRLAKVHP